MRLGLRIAARASQLSLAQAEEVAGPLRELGVHVEIVKVVSKGDMDISTPLYSMQEKGVFEKEVDLAVMRGDADVAVHSAKDVPTDLPGRLKLLAVPRRRSPFDALVSVSTADLTSMAPGSRIGTSSLRRISMLRHARPDLEIAPIRGNVDTRLEMIGVGVGVGHRGLDGVAVAEAGLERLRYGGRWSRLPPDLVVPAAGQGALMVISKDSSWIADLLTSVDDASSRLELLAEKAFVRAVGVGCRTPVGVHASLRGDVMDLTAALTSPDYADVIRASASGRVSSPDDAEGLAELVSERFAEAGGMEALGRWREVIGVG